MQILGSLDLLKKEIKKTYSERLTEFKREKTEEFNKVKSEISEKHKQELKKVKNELQNEERKVFKTTLSEELLKAKKDFENKREELINNAFQTAKEKSKDTLLNDHYLNFIKEFIKGKNNIKLAGNYKEYEKHFDIEINSKLDGIIVKQGNQVFDFTYTTFIESRKLDLRHKISNILFQNDS